ncbi:MAG: hypothetical protein AVW05_01725 [Hadesarchaea archaeon DG-33]|nr:MAG: hypothetical protein AVW05_01725 [Hadesarchaea archaeon DG-33]
MLLRWRCKFRLVPVTSVGSGWGEPKRRPRPLAVVLPGPEVSLRMSRFGCRWEVVSVGDCVSVNKEAKMPMIAVIGVGIKLHVVSVVTNDYHRMLQFVSSIPKNNYIASLQIVRQELARAYPMVLHMLMLDEMGVEIIAVWDATADYASTVPVSPST